MIPLNTTDAIEQRKNNLAQWERAHQYMFDANEAEAWMSEQELYMMVEDRGKVISFGPLF